VVRSAVAFSKPDEPAPNLDSLLEALDAEHSPGRYVYRGQTREYPGPLLPSMFRPFLSANDLIIDTSHPLARYSIRHCGRTFLGDHNFGISKAIPLLLRRCEPEDPRRCEPIFRQALNGQDVARLQVNKRLGGDLLSWWDALGMVLSADDDSVFRKYREEWQPVIDRYHRRAIRMFFFYLLFGYTFGSLLAQQYGLNSACLDATTSLDVAAFFASHTHQNDYAAPLASGVGIVYRFPHDQAHSDQINLAHGNYYVLPPTIDVLSLVKRQVGPGNAEEVMGRFEHHAHAVYSESEEVAADWTFPEAALEKTRFWRQAAALVIPDELRKDLPGKKAGVAGITIPAFQYVEDLTTRPGVEKLYFLHTGALPSRRGLTREYVWPRDDPYVPMIAAGMTASYPVERFLPHPIPYRLDLIDPGYGGEEFVRFCRDVASAHPLHFSSGSEWDEEQESDMRLAMAHGALPIRFG
jgi:hypothetical protein